MAEWKTERNSRIIRLRTIKCNSYLVFTKGRTFLIDPGSKSESSSITAKVRRLAQTLNAVILTHTHFDHAGCTEAVCKAFNCPVVVSPRGVRWLREGWTPIPKGTTPFISGLIRLVGGHDLWFMHYPPFSGRCLLPEEFETLFPDAPLKFLSTPGHTEDSISVILDETACFTGDTMASDWLTDALFPGCATQPEIIHESWKKIALTKANHFFPGHGNDFTRDRMLRNL